MKKLFMCIIGIFTFCNIGYTHKLTEVIQNVLPAVVYIEIEYFIMVDHIDAATGKVTKIKKGIRSSTGSGFMISSDTVVTNYHVISFAIKNNTKIEISFKNNDINYIAKILGYDKIADIALLKIKGNHPFVKIVNSYSFRAGDPIFSISHFYGIGWSTTQGIISSDDHEDNRFPYIKHLQIQLLLGTGSSGGPVFNEYGDVIAINHNIISMFLPKPDLPKDLPMLSPVGFAIRADTLQTTIERIKKEIIVTRADLGAILINFSVGNEFHEKYAPNNFLNGVFVLDIDTKNKTTLKPLDLIISVDKHAYTDPEKLLNYIDEKYNPEDIINMQVYRDKKIINIAVTLVTAER